MHPDPNEENQNREPQRGPTPATPPPADPGTADGLYYDRSDLRTITDNASAGRASDSSPGEPRPYPTAGAGQPSETSQPPLGDHHAH